MENIFIDESAGHPNRTECLRASSRMVVLTNTSAATQSLTAYFLAFLVAVFFAAGCVKIQINFRRNV